MGAIGTPGMAGMVHQPQHQQALHTDQLEQHPAVMDQFLDHMFSFPPWPEMSGRSSPWDYNGAGSAIGLDCGSVGSLNTAQKLFKLAQAPQAGAIALSRTRGDGQECVDTTARENAQYASPPDDPLLGSRLPQRHGLHDRSPGLGSAAAKLQGSPSVGSSESEGSPGLQGCRDQSPSSVAPRTWRQPYAVGVPTVPMTAGPNNGDAGNTEAYLGKRGRDEADISRDNRSVTAGLEGPQGPYPTFGVQLGQASVVRTAGQQTHQQATPPSQVTAPVAGQVYGAAQAVSALQQSQGHTQGVPAVAKPRVRARRGQATDPHSIAERLRRERIAERMKALQELVPNANKTDKASMLDEIIDYVKFLQLQVKVLSMSRLGGTGAAPPLVSDLPIESASSFTTVGIGRNSSSGPSSDGLALTERQVARLMEEDMGTAMQYLQSKGLCLMPISLASAISSNGQRPQTVGSTGLVNSSSDRQRSEPSVVVSSSGGVPAADKARPTKENREAGIESKTNMGSAEC